MEQFEGKEIFYDEELKEAFEEMQFEEAEKILSWRDMRPGIYKYHGIEHRGTNDFGRPLSVISLEIKEGVKMLYYAHASL